MQRGADDKQAIAQQVRIEQIIVGSLAGGVLVFLAIVFLLNSMGKANPAQAARAPVLSYYIGPPLGVVTLILSFVVPRVVTTQARRGIAQGKWDPSIHQFGPPGMGTPTAPPSDAVKLANLHLTTSIIGGALVEGGAFMMGIAYFIEHQTWVLLAAIALVMAILIRFPTREGVEQWIDNQLELIEQDKLLSG